MRRLRATDRLVDGRPCMCELCRKRRASRAAKAITAISALLGFILMGLCLTLPPEYTPAAIVCGLGAFPLLFIAAMASLGVLD